MVEQIIRLVGEDERYKIKLIQLANIIQLSSSSSLTQSTCNFDEGMQNAGWFWIFRTRETVKINKQGPCTRNFATVIFLQERANINSKHLLQFLVSPKTQYSEQKLHLEEELEPFSKHNHYKS